MTNNKNEQLALDKLPANTLQEIASRISFFDWRNLAQTNRNLRKIWSVEIIWRKFLQYYFPQEYENILHTKLETPFKQLFQLHYSKPFLVYTESIIMMSVSEPPENKFLLVQKWDNRQKKENKQWHIYNHFYLKYRDNDLVAVNVLRKKYPGFLLGTYLYDVLIRLPRRSSMLGTWWLIERNQIILDKAYEEEINLFKNKAADNAGITPLHLAVAYNQEAIELVYESYNVTRPRTKVPSLLMIATKTNNLKMVKRLCKVDKENKIRQLQEFAMSDNRITYSLSILHEAARYGYFDLVKYFVKHGALIDQSSGPINRRMGSEMGKTPLHFAAEEGHLPIVKYLVELGANCKIDYSAAKDSYHDVTKRNGYYNVCAYLTCVDILREFKKLGENPLIQVKELYRWYLEHRLATLEALYIESSYQKLVKNILHELEDFTDESFSMDGFTKAVHSAAAKTKKKNVIFWLKSDDYKSLPKDHFLKEIETYLKIILDGVEDLDNRCNFKAG